MLLMEQEMSGKDLGCDWFFPSAVLLAFCSIYLCWFYLIGNTVFSCWGGWKEGEKIVPRKEGMSKRRVYLPVMAPGNCCTYR